jgi:hypothetical protein
MSLADKLASTQRRGPGLPCSVAIVLEVLSDKDAQALRDALAVPKGNPNRLSAQHISDLLNEEGHRVPQKSLELHRKGACRCGAGRSSAT